MKNIFDDDQFFESYQHLRQDGQSLNDLVIDPALERLLPDLTGKTVLDLGCGDGRHCADFIARGACKVIGIDISENMLQAARMEHADSAIRYLKMSITKIADLNETFDFIYSNMAFHYIEDFHSLAITMYRALNPNGSLLFAQEHPVITATKGGKGHHRKSVSGKKVAYVFSDYGMPGERVTHWFVDGVVKYHRRVCDILNALIDAGFLMTRVEEPLPEQQTVARYPTLADQFIKPTFLIVKAKKQ